MVSDGAESAAEKPPLPEVADEDVAWRPRWWFLGVFAVLAAIHLVGGWASTTAIGLAVGFACTLVLVFVRRLPPWLTGGWWSPGPWLSRSGIRARRNRLTCVLLLVWLPAAAIVAGIAEHPPHGVDIVYAVFVLGCGLSLLVLVLVRWARTLRILRLLAGSRTPLPARIDQQELVDGDPLARYVTGTVIFPDGSPGYFTLRDCPIPLVAAIEHTGRLWVTSALPGTVLAGLPDGDDFAHAVLATSQSGLHGRAPISRAALGRHLRPRTFALATVMVLGVALEITVFVTLGGALTWVLLVPLLLAVVAAVNWRSRVASPVRLLAAGPWTEVAAAVVAQDIRPGRPMLGWARFSDGIRARFRVANCPPDIATELVNRRHLWVAGEPREGKVAIGIPDSDTFAIAVFTVKQREYRRTRARRSPSLETNDRTG
ncbi:hypothetical protein [Saccharopolyspora spinosa]|uniref:Uncharacterized protein n=1 Tax=Saccharopolyspora spinosa TaxID=60894 RepID=A0A2N3Y0A3_SACSN|nr:hypothetical protein [Saccharopolyspora spinosa]PKW16349.1 hypothetical protein A8926_4172 [Saccharopolyspora spinosa]